jgi:hypothetical protein
MKRSSLSLCVWLLVLASGCTHVRKVFDGPPGGVASGDTAGYFFQEENDSIAPGNRDKFYTQGLRWGKTFTRNPDLVAKIGTGFCARFCSGFNYRPLWTSGVAQTMYTPDDVAVPVPQPFDRPWAGFIYLDNTVRLVEDTPQPRTQLVLELKTGSIGKRSGAQWAQSALHELIGAAHPEWPDQLERHVAIELTYLWNRRYGNGHVDVLPFAGGALGNTMVYTTAGTHVRLGWNLGGFLNTGPMQGTFALGGSERPPTEGFLYLGGAASYIPYNYFLSRGEIEPKRRVHDLMAGASFRYRSYRVTYNFVRRSREFEHPLAPKFSAHDYGSLVLSYELIIP